MEVNKEAAEQCKVIGATALRQGEYEKAVKFFKRSLSLYPLPGVEALLASANRAAQNASTAGNRTTSSSSSSASSSTAANGTSRENSTGNNSGSQQSNSSTRRAAAAAAPSPAAAPSGSASSTAGTGGDGRAYTQAQVAMVEKVLRAKQGGRGAHYRVLELQSTCTEAEIKRSYRKLALKLHPDKNSAPKADEAFKAVGLAYGTLSDPQKRTIYDRYGEEDPDNRGGGGGGGVRHGGGGGVHFRPGQEVSPEDIFNMFFGGGMAGGGMGGMHRGPGGMHFYSNFGGPGVRARPRQQQQQQRGAGAAQEEQGPAGMAGLLQLVPFLLILILSFFNMSDTSSLGAGAGAKTPPGLNRYFALTKKEPFINPLYTKLTKVKDIPYWVDNKIFRTVNRDRYQLSQVERMVEGAYETYLVEECNRQRKYKKSLVDDAGRKPTEDEREIAKKTAQQFELSRCVELNDLFPLRHSGRKR